MNNYRAIVHREGDEYWAEVPALPGCYAMAATMAELRRNVAAAIREHLAAFNSIPAPEGARCVRVAT